MMPLLTFTERAKQSDLDPDCLTMKEPFGLELRISVERSLKKRISIEFQMHFLLKDS